MRNKENNELFRSNNSSVKISILFISIVSILLILSILKDEKGLSVIFLIIFFVLFYSLLRVKTTIFYENHISQIKFWIKKEIWNCKYEEVRKVNITYFSDTSYRSKQIHFYLNDRQIKKIIILNIQMDELFKKVFERKKIPVYIEKNDTFVLYDRGRVSD